jgi:hypothetical protein
LLAAKTDGELLSVIQDDIEDRWERDWLFQTDKSWATIHRCLTDGRLLYDNGEYPLRACVLDGEYLYEGDDYIVSFLTPTQVADVTSGLAPIDKSWLRARYATRGTSPVMVKGVSAPGRAIRLRSHWIHTSYGGIGASVFLPRRSSKERSREGAPILRGPFRTHR